MLTVTKRRGSIAKRGGRSKQRLLETLESRLMMSVSVFEYGSPGAGSVSASHMVADSSGNIYQMALGGGILKLDPISGTQTFIDLPNETAGPALLNYADLTIGADGNLWITESFVNPNSTDITDLYYGDVIKVTTGGTLLATYTLGTNYGLPLSPNWGPNGKLYIGVSSPGAAAPDGNGTFVNSIVEMSTNGSFLTHSVVKSDGYISDLKVSGDGDVFVSLSGNAYDPGNAPAYETDSALAVLHNGSVTAIPLNGAANPKGMLFNLSIAPDGSVWLPLVYNGNSFSGGANQIVKATFDGAFNPTYTSYSIPGVAADDIVFAGSIVAATDGNIYVTETAGDHVDIVNTATSTVSRVAIPSGDTVWSQPQQIGNAIYFADQVGNHFARIDLPLSGSGTSVVALAGQSATNTMAVLNTTLSAAQIAGLTATIYWGDASSSTGTIVNNGNGTVSVNGTHTYASPGDYGTRVVVTGSTIDAVTVVGDATVTPAATFSASGIPVAAHQENSTFSAVVASFIGPAANYTATINWGNGVTTNGTITLVSGVYSVVGSINYATQGNYNISVHIVGGSNNVTVGTSVAISDIPLVVTAAAPIVLLGRIAIGTTAFFTDDPDSNALRYNASINWGDNSTSAGVIVPLGGGQYTVLSLHTYRRGGNYTLTTTVTTISGEDAGKTASASIVLHV